MEILVFRGLNNHRWDVLEAKLNQAFETADIKYAPYSMKNDSPEARALCFDVLDIDYQYDSGLYVVSYFGDEVNFHIATYDTENGFLSAMVFEVADSKKALMLKLALS
jgi:hypothetical protein